MENVFPPVPADTAVALGAFLSRGEEISALGVFAVTWASNVAGALVVYGGAYIVGRRFFTGRIGSRLLRPRALARIERLYARHGLWGIFVSRFIPGVRAVVPPFAGIARLTPLKAVPPMAVASAVWYGVLTYIAATVAGRLEDLARLLAQVNRVALAMALAAVAVAVVVWHARRGKRGRRERRGRREAPEGHGPETGITDDG